MGLHIHGFNKTTLLDYPGHLASTVFLGGCNFRCPFCHNATLVLSPESQPVISKEEVFNTLNKRKGIIEGVCITGGEPTLYPDLIHFIEEIKDMGLLVKLDTNGSNPDMLNKLLSLNLIDYVAMDIKNSKEKYGVTTGLTSISLDNISKSISILLSTDINYEFRTTVVKEFHSSEDLISIGRWIKGAKAYYLQAYKDSEDIISPGLNGYSKSELDLFRQSLLPFAHEVGIRGIE